ncbi:L-aspartate oxidase [Spirochaeta lutea]|uniref:L-aspartate oxidase n=1 Tax=Spirochaeta lutea TaxID=1480694 RepID=A0A098R1M7_9SPIO|nr:L-aspartate oxidase [Spirochaeta lutea]KGE73854.1 aspartate oxidase [Spirochaeta lutea]
MEDTTRRSNLLVIGSGLAGLSAAVAAAEQGLTVTVLSKSENLTESNTLYAQGGIVETGIGDSPDLLIRDIIDAGSGLNNSRSVRILAESGPELVADYLVRKAEVPFERGEEGEFDRTREGAHTVRRILHVNDQTGRAIQEQMLGYARSCPGITLLSGHIAVDIITNTHHSTDYQQRYKRHRALGAYVLNQQTGEIRPFYAESTVIATGGIGNLYLHTSNPESATGDGIAMAYRAGCSIINAEYVQFHPTVLFHRDVKRFLITEALRGEGARLLNTKGEYFMERYHPRLRDLAPRDEVARAIYREMDGSTGYVYLDARDITHVNIADRFPGIYEQCKALDIDIVNQPIPVVPAAHYFCGGIKVDEHSKTEIDGLYVVGESSCTGVHGANRLASVSLLEALVFGIRAGHHAAIQQKPLRDNLIASIPDWVYPKQPIDFDPLLIQHDMFTLQSTMWNYVGIVRSKRRLDRALADLNYFTHRIEKFYQEARAGESILALRNAVLVGTLITKAAAGNHRSLGCHYRTDSMH